MSQKLAFFQELTITSPAGTNALSLAFEQPYSSLLQRSLAPLVAFLQQPSPKWAALEESPAGPGFLYVYFDVVPPFSPPVDSVDS